MFASKTVFRYGLAIIAALVGYAVAGSLGFAVGMGLVLLSLTTWYTDAASVEYETALGVLGRRLDITYRPPTASRAMVNGILCCAVLFFLYSVVLSFGHNSRVDVAWMRTLQPAVSWLAVWVPALDRMPLDLIKNGQAEWAPAVQHVLFVGWLFLGLSATWIAVDVLIVNRRSWSRVRPLISRRGWAKMILLLSIVIGASSLILLFGLGASGRKGFGGEFGPPMLAVCFLGVVGFFFVLAVSCNVLLMWSRTDDDVLVERVMAANPLLVAMVRRAIDGKSERRTRES